MLVINKRRKWPTNLLNMIASLTIEENKLSQQRFFFLTNVQISNSRKNNHTWNKLEPGA